MKTLRCISTAVLACLALAVPASAAEVSLSLSTTSTTLGTPITATASGVATTNYGVAIIKEAPCTKANATTMVFGVNEGGPFDQTVTLPATGYPTVGTYNVCAEVDHWTTVAQATLAVLAVPLPPPPPPAPVVAPAPAPPVTSAPAPPVTSAVAPKPVVKPLTTTQKLHKALAKCKRQHPKSKRVKCERAAKRAAKHR
jgi:hypothetical protein